MRVLKWLVVTMTGTRPATCVEAQRRAAVALVVGQQELLGVVGQDADAVDALVDHAVEHAALAVEVEVAVVVNGVGAIGKTPVSGLPAAGDMVPPLRTFRANPSGLRRYRLPAAMVLASSPPMRHTSFHSSG